MDVPEAGSHRRTIRPPLFDEEPLRERSSPKGSLTYLMADSTAVLGLAFEASLISSLHKVCVAISDLRVWSCEEVCLSSIALQIS